MAKQTKNNVAINGIRYVLFFILLCVQTIVYTTITSSAHDVGRLASTKKTPAISPCPTLSVDTPETQKRKTAPHIPKETSFPPKNILRSEISMELTGVKSAHIWTDVTARVDTTKLFSKIQLQKYQKSKKKWHTVKRYTKWKKEIGTNKTPHMRIEKTWKLDQKGMYRCTLQATAWKHKVKDSAYLQSGEMSYQE